jgi:prepilin-type processing-associated H-X9-DG protein
MGSFLVSVVIMQTVANYLYPPRLALPRGLDAAGGAILGLVNACFLTGFLMVVLGLFPGTGGPDEKVVFLNADVFFARSMEWINCQAGSATFRADEFLKNVRKEKYEFTVHPRSDLEVRDENGECFMRLERLGRVLEEYVKKNNGRYPDTLDELKDYIPGRLSDEKREEMLRCPVTKFRYKLFRPRDYEAIKGDKLYVLLYDAVGGETGHLGNGLGKRPAFFADGHVRWVTEADLAVYLKAQQEALKKTE